MPYFLLKVPVQGGLSALTERYTCLMVKSRSISV